MHNVYVHLNGRLVPKEEACVSPLDRGFLYGDGFFETIRVCQGLSLLLDEHLERLVGSCRKTGWERLPSAQKLREGVARLIEENGLRDCYLRISVSAGPHSGPLTEWKGEHPTLFIEVRQMELPPLDAPPPLVLARSYVLMNSTSPTANHKSLSYQENLLALAEGRKSGADEVYRLNEKGLLTEGAISNLFFVRDGAVFTPAPSCGLLPGITRAAVLAICRKEDIPAEEGEYGERDLLDAEEVFCTNSLKGVMAVREILADSPIRFPDASLTTRLQGLYADFVRDECGEGAR